MVRYTLNYTIPSPGPSTTFVEFSSNGRFLAVGDRDLSSLYILDKLAGFHPIISCATSTRPTALVWEASKAFYVGLSNGTFIQFQIDLKGRKLVQGDVNNFFRGPFPVTAIALDTESKTLVLSVGPDVFAFRRTHTTSKFHFVANVSSRFNFEKDPGTPAPPFPRSIGFTPNNKLVITFCRQNIASVTLEFDGTHLCASFQTAKIDYSGLSLLMAITSASENEIHRLTRSWVYGGDTFPFLFVNGGAETLSGSELGAAILRDAITQREIQLLEHTAIAGRNVSVMAYHVSKDRFSIATGDCGANARVKIWTARRPSDTQVRSPHRFLRIMSAMMITLILVTLRKSERPPSIKEIVWFCCEVVLVFAKVCIEIGYHFLDAAEDVVFAAWKALG